MSKSKNHLPPDDLPPEVERQISEWEEEERVNRSPAEWWEEDHLRQLDDSDAGKLTAALDGLVVAGCSRAELLGYLCDIESAVTGYSLIPVRTLRGLVERVRSLAKRIERLEYVPYHDQAVKMLRDIAEVWELASKKETAEQSTARLVKRLTRYVDGKVRERGRLGKGPGDMAVALLVEEVTHSKRTHHAIRVARLRMKPKGPSAKGEKRPAVRRLPGSGYAGRQRKRLSLDKAEAELARKRLSTRNGDN
jgi:hypothetical protein